MMILEFIFFIMVVNLVGILDIAYLNKHYFIVPFDGIMSYIGLI